MSLAIEKEGRDLLINTREGDVNKTWLRIPVGLMADGVVATARGTIRAGQSAVRGVKVLKANYDRRTKNQ